MPTASLFAATTAGADSLGSLVQSAGLAPTNDAESAIIRSLSPGSYTAVVRGKDGGTGVALVEVYNLQ